MGKRGRKPTFEGKVEDLARRDIHHSDTQVGSDAEEETMDLIEDLVPRLFAEAERICRDERGAKRINREDVIRADDRLRRQ